MREEKRRESTPKTDTQSIVCDTHTIDEEDTPQRLAHTASKPPITGADKR